MAMVADNAGFEALMAGHTTAQLLAILRKQHDYVPSAVAAAHAELRRREVSGFDVANAVDAGEVLAATDLANANLRLSQQWMALWLLFPFLALTPIGAIYFKRLVERGFRRRSLMFLEAVTIGFMGYMILLMLGLAWL